ncbi:MAG: alpha/beta fold hydrolase [Bacteroidales bacterium]
MKKVLNIIVILLYLVSCKKDNPEPIFTETRVGLSGKSLATYSVIKNTEYLLVFESGLGDDHSVWINSGILSQIIDSTDVLLYDRAGYGSSDKGLDARNIVRLQSELDTVINSFSNGRKLILIGHSLGGMIIRDYAIQHPESMAGLVFIDPSHENYNQPSQSDEDAIYSAFLTAYGAGFGGTAEARELIEDSQYLETLPALPDIPVIVITSMKTDESHSASDRQKWFDAHESLKTGLTDFSHITTIQSGHYIMLEEPSLVLNSIHSLLSKKKMVGE